MGQDQAVPGDRRRGLGQAVIFSHSKRMEQPSGCLAPFPADSYQARLLASSFPVPSNVATCCCYLIISSAPSGP